MRLQPKAESGRVGVCRRSRNGKPEGDREPTIEVEYVAVDGKERDKGEEAQANRRAPGEFNSTSGTPGAFVETQPRHERK